MKAQSKEMWLPINQIQIGTLQQSAIFFFRLVGGKRFYLCLQRLEHNQVYSGMLQYECMRNQ